MDALAERLRAAAARAGGGNGGGNGASVVADARGSLALPDLVRRADEVAREVGRTAAGPRPVVAVVLPSSVDAVVQLAAAVLGGHTVCFLDPASGTRTGAVLDALAPDLVVDRTGLHPHRAGARSRRGDPGAGGYVAMSSGTTGSAPKGVLTTWECLADFAPHGAAALDVDATARWGEPTHPSYDLALTNWVLVLAAGASLHVSGSLADRVRPLAFLARRAASHVRLAPGYADLAAAEAARGTPCGVRVWGSGGDRLTRAQAATVLGLGPVTLVNTYGTSETAGFASAAAYASTDELRTRDGSVGIGSGRLGPWQVALVPEHGGHDVIAVHSPHVGAGYLFGGGQQDYPRWEQDRVVTGDLGVAEGGDLFCLGRVGRLVKRSAGFVNLDDVDAVVRDLRGVASFTVATRGGSLVTLVEGEVQAVSAVLEDLATRLAPAVLPDRLLPVRALPRLGNGKTDQAGALALAELALAEPALAELALAERAVEQVE